jgi:outer membrane porin, OprD family
MAGFNSLRAGLRVVAITTLVMGFWPTGWRVLAQGAEGGVAGSVDSDTPDIPIPSTAHETYSPIVEGFASPLEPRAELRATQPPKPPPQAQAPPPEADEVVWLSFMRQRLKDDGPFVRDTELKVNSRTYWLTRQSIDGSHAEALTSGGSVAYQSGYLGDFLQLRGVLYTTQPLYAPATGGGTENLTLDQQQITTLGQANARFKIAGQEASIGRQLIRTAFINPRDNRMIPLTFEGVILVPERREDQGLDYIASYLSRYKPRDTDEFIPFSEPLGVKKDEGVLITGIRRTFDGLTLGTVNYWIKDTINATYGEADYLLPTGAGDGPSYRISFNDLDQRSVGEQLVPGAPFNTFQASARFVAGYQGIVLTTAVSTTGKDANIRDPFGNIPVYTSMHQSSFERAGERAYLVTLSYDFSAAGLDGLKFLVGWGQGVDAIDPTTGASEPDRNLLNLRLDYEPSRGPLEGLQVQLYYSDERLLTTALPRDDQSEFRVVVNYLMPLL